MLRNSVKKRLNVRISVRESVHKNLRTSHRCITGYLAVGAGRSVSYASTLERDWLTCLDFDLSVSNIRSQPFTLEYVYDGKNRRYSPDIAVDLTIPTDRVRGVVYEVKPADELKEKWAMYRPRFLAAVSFCRSNGLMFRVVTEDRIYTPYYKNAYFFRQFLRLPVNEVTVAKIMYTFRALGESTPQELMAAAFLPEDLRREALPTLWQLIATRKIKTNLDREVTYLSPIWLPDT